jgi:hypothetical protein
MAKAKEQPPSSANAIEPGAFGARINPKLERSVSHESQNLNFKVSSEFKKRFKRYALDHDLTMIQLLAEGFELVQQKRGK